MDYPVSIGYLNQSPILDSNSSPLTSNAFERALTPGIKSNPPTPNYNNNNLNNLNNNHNLNNNTYTPSPPPPQQQQPKQQQLQPTNQQINQQTNQQPINQQQPSQNKQQQLDPESSLSSPPSEPKQRKPAKAKKKTAAKPKPSGADPEAPQPAEHASKGLSNLSFKRKKENSRTRGKDAAKGAGKPAQKRARLAEETDSDRPAPSSPHHSSSQHPPPETPLEPPPKPHPAPKPAPPAALSKKSAPIPPIKKPVKAGFKKPLRPPAASNPNTTPSKLAPTPAPASSLANPPQPLHLPARNKEFDLNNPQTWGALFGGGDKKPVAAKPVKPGNLPPQAALTYNGKSIDRLEARKKQRLEEKRILLEQSRIGFDLLRQNLEMMDFEIEYKNHVRAMVERPVEMGGSQEAEPQGPSQGRVPERRSGESGAGSGQESSGASRGLGRSVLCRPDGYKRYLNPPADPAPSLIGFQSQQPPGPIYSSSFPSNALESNTLHRKILPRPGMFGSSFFIWQAHHLS